MNNKRRRYRKKDNQFIVAVRLDLETEGFTYFKWGSQQRCKRGDWVADNNGDVYTIDHKVFLKTYRQIAPGHYVKINPVWAEVADSAGWMPTKEGRSRYEAGDYLVFNDEEGTDGYCMSKARFEAMYEPD